jgi:signal peptidase I
VGCRGAVRRRVLLSLVSICVAVLLARAFLVESYAVCTPSMEPTLLGHPEHGDRLLVDRTRFLRAPPERWMLAVLRGEGGEGAFVKRVVGLPGDELTIAKGELFNRGTLLAKPRNLVRRLLVPVHESRADFPEFDAFWVLLAGAARHDREGLAVVPDRSGDAAIQTRDEVTDGVLDASGRFRPGEHAVGDLEVSLVVRTEPGCERLEVRILDGFDRLVIALYPDAPGRVVVPGRSPFSVPALRLEPGTDQSLRVSNVDDRLVVVLDARDQVALDYASENPGRPDDPEGRRNLVEIRLHGRSGALLRRLGLRRDLFYTAAGSHGTHFPAIVGEDSYFVLGDNSAVSRDSRQWGAISGDRLIGSPFLILWPLSRIRLL